MSHEGRLQTRLRERQELLDRATRLLKADERIAAAWLIGSLGRGDPDDWSDIDLWIVVSDNSIEAVTAARDEFAANLGIAVLFEDAPHNAPLGGAFLTAMYCGTGGAHMVDMYWQPLALATRPPDTLLLFERVSIPMVEGQPVPHEHERMERAVQAAGYFLVMSAIVAKSIARQNTWKVIQLLIPTANVLEQVRWLLRERSEPPTYREVPTFDVPWAAADQLRALRRLLDELSRLVEKEPALHDAIDSEAIEQVRQLCSSAEREVTYFHAD